MNSYLIVLLAVGLSSALPSNKPHPLSDEAIAQINNKQSTWRAGRNFEVEEYELFKKLVSGIKPEDDYKRVTLIHDEDEDIPESFDAREAWPECAEIIGLIRDQSRCAASWAFATVEAMSDRICIHSNGTKRLHVSAQDLLTCGKAGDCQEGFPSLAWNAWSSSGIVTGGLYNHSEQGCKSYFLPNCDDHLDKCTDYVDSPACVEQCDDSSLDYNAQKTYGFKRYDLDGEKQIQLEILKNGPVKATMNVFSDFANYKSGIYQLTTDDYLGGQAVKIIGWGVENDVKYWLLANSWNERWGENGFFRIIRGQDEVGIEEAINAALPDFSKF